MTGGLGAIFLGSGISCAIESGFLKHEGAQVWHWVLAGTGSLALIIAGVILLIKAAFLEQGTMR